MATKKGRGLPLPVVVDNWFRYHERDGSHKYVAYASTYAELETACESSTIEEVHLIANCTGDSTIVITNDTDVYAHGFEVDWNGAVNGYMFHNDAGNDITLHGLIFKKTGNAYFPVRLNNSIRLIGCKTPDTGILNFRLLGSYGEVANCEFTYGYLECNSGNYVSIHDNVCADAFYIVCVGRGMRVCDNVFLSTAQLHIRTHSGYSAERNMVISGNVWHETTGTRCIYIQAINASSLLHVIIAQNIFDTNNDDCIELQDTANLTVSEITVTDNIFKDSAVGIKIPAACTVSKWRFGNNAYPGTTAPYSFTDPGDFVYSKDHLFDGAFDYFNSSSVLTGGVISDGGLGTVDVTAGTALIKTTNADDGHLVAADFSAVTALVLTDDATNFIYLNYNAGSPVIAATSSFATLFDKRTAAIGSVYREGNTVYIINTTNMHSNLQNAANIRLFEMYGGPARTFAGGLMIGETGVRNISLTAGTYYLGLNRQTGTAFDTSGADTFKYFYRDGGGGWTEVAAQSAINNTNWDDGDGVLGVLTANRYGVHWVYTDWDNGHIFVVYGQGDYKLAEAIEAVPPSSLPDILTKFGLLVGKIIIQKNAAAFTSTLSRFTETFGASAVINHNDLSNIGANDHVHDFAGAAHNADTWADFLTKISDETPLKSGDASLITTRSPAAWDWDEGDFLVNGAWDIDGLDVSGIVPAGATLVWLAFGVKDAANKYLVFRQNAAAVASVAAAHSVPNGSWVYKTEPITVDADRKLDYIQSADITDIVAAVVGWSTPA